MDVEFEGHEYCETCLLEQCDNCPYGYGPDEELL